MKSLVNHTPPHQLLSPASLSTVEPPVKLWTPYLGSPITNKCGWGVVPISAGFLALFSNSLRETNDGETNDGAESENHCQRHLSLIINDYWNVLKTQVTVLQTPHSRMEINNISSLNTAYTIKLSITWTTLNTNRREYVSHEGVWTGRKNCPYGCKSNT